MKKLMLLTSVAAMIAAPALANTYKDRTMRDGDMRGDKMSQRTEYYFKQIDTNGDNYISRNEQEAFSRKMWNEADSNNDGRLSMQEIKDQKSREMAQFRSQYGDAYMSPSAGGNGTRTANQDMLKNRLSLNPQIGDPVDNNTGEPRDKIGRP